MFCYRRLINKLINSIHGTLKLIYNSFTELLKMKDDSTIHPQNILTLVKELYKFMNNLSPPIPSNSSHNCGNIYNIWNFQQLANTKKNTLNMSIEKISYYYFWCHSFQICFFPFLLTSTAILVQLNTTF